MSAIHTIAIAASTSQGERACNSTTATKAPSRTTMPANARAGVRRRLPVVQHRRRSRDDPEHRRESANGNHDRLRPAGTRLRRWAEQQCAAEHERRTDEHPAAGVRQADQLGPFMRGDRNDCEHDEAPSERRQQEQCAQDGDHQDGRGDDALGKDGSHGGPDRDGAHASCASTCACSCSLVRP